MHFVRIAILVLLAVTQASCTVVWGNSGGDRIETFSDRSVVFTWVDMSQAHTNVRYGVIERLKPVTEDRYYAMGVHPYEGGYILYHIGLPNGAFKFRTFTGNACLLGNFLLCSVDTVYRIPKQGGLGGVKVDEPGIYYLGGFQYQVAGSNGFFRRSNKFNLVEAEQAPDPAAMLMALHRKLAARFPEPMKKIEIAMDDKERK